MENEILIIMDEQQEDLDVSNTSFHSSFSRIRSDELNDMGYGLNCISPFTFEGDDFQTSNNRTQGRVPTLTPRKKKDAGTDVNRPGQPLNKTVPAQQTERPQDQSRSRSYDAEASVKT